MGYEVLFIDWDGTLSGSRFWGHWDKHPTHSQKYKAIQKHLFGQSDGMLEQWMRGGLTTEQAIELLAVRTTIDPSELIQNLEISCKQMQFFDPRLPELLNQARAAGIKVVIATDNMDTFSRWTTSALGLDRFCDDILNSHTLHGLKRDKAPDGSSKFFADYLAKHAVSPNRAVLIDDNASNQLVKDFGIDYLQVTPQYSATQALNDILPSRS
jgi:FMN phosphatase YigB (HAD superfamily)